MDILEIGQGSATIVAVHGIQGTRASWLPIAEQLSEQARWILPNLRGRGRAERGFGPADYTLDSYAAELAAVIAERAATGPLYLAGWSMGVSVALAYLSRPDARVPDGLFLLSGSPALNQTHWFTTTEPQALRKEIAERERRLGLREAADHDAVAWTWQAISPTSQRALLPSIAIPTRILHGSADDDSPPQHAEWLRQGLPNASLCMFEGAGHGILMAPSSSRVAAEIQQFIHRPSIARTTAIQEAP
ncbi:MAG: hypothetical protein JWP38_3024 [Herbaspirillum sp.]|nr:hypothetical protein [Herbaspirillum sp.]